MRAHEESPDLLHNPLPGHRGRPLTSTEAVILDHVRIAADAAADKQAGSVQILDIRSLSGVTDYFLICDGSSQRQVQAIVEEIDRRLRENQVRPDHMEGGRGAEWVLMDYLDFVIHVFTKDRREFYGLEKLWSDAPRLELPEITAEGAARRS
jgi:ribosome-associated protein